MNVLICGNYRMPHEEATAAIPRVIQDLLFGFNTHKFKDLNIQILARKENINNDFSSIVDGTVIHYFAKRKPRILSSVIRDVPALRKKIKKINPDIVHAQAPLLAYCAIKENFPTVLTLHGMIWRELEYDFSSKNLIMLRRGIGQKFIYANLYDKMLEKLKNIILISPYVESIIKDRTKATRYFIENPISEKFFNIKKTVNKDKHFIFTLGTISPRKNTFSLARISKILSEKYNHEFFCEIAGLIQDPTYYKKIVSYLKNNAINNVKLIGKIQIKELLEKYAKMSLFCLPSKQETAPLVISESMAAGKPVVASRICGIPYMVEERKTGFTVNPDDNDGFANKISMLLGDEDLRKEMGRRAKEEANKRWHPNIVAKKTYEVYREIIEG